MASYQCPLDIVKNLFHILSIVKDLNKIPTSGYRTLASYVKRKYQSLHKTRNLLIQLARQLQHARETHGIEPHTLGQLQNPAQISRTDLSNSFNSTRHILLQERVREQSPYKQGRSNQPRINIASLLMSSCQV